MELLPPGAARSPAPASRRVLLLGALCIAALECSQLVFPASNRAPWTDIGDQLARASAEPAGRAARA